MEHVDRNKWLLLLSSLGVLALLIAAAIEENVLLEWRQIQAQARTDEGPLPVQLRQVVNPALGVADRCVSCHVTMAPGEQGVTAAGMGSHPTVVHDPSEYGCTVCHGGQGRATRKDDAHGAVEFWPQPMLPVGMSQAGCGTCHAAVGVPGRERLDAARATFERLDCLACHKVDGRGGFVPGSRWRHIDGPDLSQVALLGYDADWYAGHQRVAAGEANGPWTASFGPISDRDRTDVDLFLSTRVGAPRLIDAKGVFHATGCLGCHRVNGVGGDEGPDLTRAGDTDPGRVDFSAVPGPRTLAAWFAAHVRAPAAVVSGSRMPAASVSDAEVEALTFYTLSLRRREVPGTYLPRDRMRVSRFGEREFTSDGGTLFGAFCSGCHGRRGEGRQVPGMSFPSVTNPDFLAVAPDALIVESILRGRSGRRMRAWGDGSTGLKADDAKAILGYLRTEAGVAAPVDGRSARWVRGDEALGGRLFAASCSGCHGANGEGKDGPALNNPVLQQFATDSYLVETIARGRRGTAMASFLEPSSVRRTLSRPEIEAIVTFIRSWGGKP
jgi:mono/diheme cytochrome c family protein